MKIIIETIVTSSIVGLCISMGSYMLAKRMIKSEKEALFQEIPDKIVAYLSTPEAQVNLRNVGIIMASGVVKELGLSGLAPKGKTWGIPNVLLFKFADRLLPKKGDKAISKENEGTTSGKFG